MGKEVNRWTCAPASKEQATRDNVTTASPFLITLRMLTECPQLSTPAPLPTPLTPHPSPPHPLTPSPLTHHLTLRPLHTHFTTQPFLPNDPLHTILVRHPTSRVPFITPNSLYFSFSCRYSYAKVEIHVPQLILLARGRLADLVRNFFQNAVFAYYN